MRSELRVKAKFNRSHLDVKLKRNQSEVEVTLNCNRAETETNGNFILNLLSNFSGSDIILPSQRTKPSHLPGKATSVTLENSELLCETIRML